MMTNSLIRYTEFFSSIFSFKSAEQARQFFYLRCGGSFGYDDLMLVIDPSISFSILAFKIRAIVTRFFKCRKAGTILAPAFILLL